MFSLPFGTTFAASDSERMHQGLADLQGLEKNLLQCMNNKTGRGPRVVRLDSFHES